MLSYLDILLILVVTESLNFNIPLDEIIFKLIRLLNYNYDKQLWLI